MIIIVFFSYLNQLGFPDLFLLLFQNAVLYLWSDPISSLPLQEIDLSKHLPESCLFVVCDLLLCGFEMLLENLEGEVVYLLISQMLDLFIHYSNHSCLLDSDDVVDDDPLHRQ